MNGSHDHDERDPGLDAAYRRASSMEAGGPAASTRSAVLAQAQRVADEQTAVAAHAASTGRANAANESHWNWRAAAGIAAVGLAGALSLVLYRERPASQAMKPPVAVSEVAPVPAAPMVAPEATRAPEVAASPAPTPTVVYADKADALAVTTEATQSNAAPAAPRAAQSMERAAAVPGAPPAAQLLGRFFPEALDSEADGDQYWFVLDSGGQVLRSGQRAWRDLSDLRSWLENTTPAARIARVESVLYTNRRGHVMQLAYVWSAE